MLVAPIPGGMILPRRLAMSFALPILLADRDAAVLQSLAVRLRAEGHDVTIVTSGEDLLRSVLPVRTILVMDHDLGDLTAFEVIERCRDLGRDDPTLILALKRDPELTALASRFGCRVYEKPMLTDDLMKAINSYRVDRG